MIWSKKETGKKEEGTAQKSDGSFHKKYLIEHERVTKLWKAYQIQEKALKDACDKIRQLEGKKKSGTRDTNKGSGQSSDELDSCREALKREREKLAKLHDVAQILDEELKQAQKRNEEILMELEFLKEKSGVKENEGGLE